jgi:endonuclease/exonuclease/phosphatase family metal-dependent hydrolase
MNSIVILFFLLKVLLSCKDQETIGLNVASYNVFNFPGEITNDARREIKEDVFTDLLNEELVDIICLQEVNPFIVNILQYIQNDKNLIETYPNVFSIINILSEEDEELPKIACNSEQVQLLQSECAINNCGDAFLRDSGEFAFCLAIFCPETGPLLQRSECSGCLSVVQEQNVDLNTAILICSNPLDFDFKFTGGIVLLSKYELLNPRFYELPTTFLAPKNLITADIELKNKWGKKQLFSIGCTHLDSPQAFTSKNLPFITFDENVINRGVDSYEKLLNFQIETINNIFKSKQYYKKPKILLGDFNTFIEGNPLEDALPNSFQLFLDDNWEATTILDRNRDFDCTFCNRLVEDNTNDNICNSLSDVNPLIDDPTQPFQQLIDNVLIKDFNSKYNRVIIDKWNGIKVNRFMEDCFEYSIDNEAFITPISDHYATKAELKFRF